MASIDQVISKRHAGFIAWPTIFFAFICFFAFIVCVVVAALKIIPLALAFFINLVLSYMAFTPFHEAAHGNIKGKYYSLKFLEICIGYMMGLMLLGPFHSFAFIHLTHHAHTNEGKEDPDFWVHGSNYWQVLTHCLTILPYYYWFFFTSKKRAARSVFAISIITVLIFIILMFIIGSLSSIKILFFTWLLPSILANAFLAFFLDYIPHHPHSTHERYKNSNVIYGKLIYVISMAHSFHVVHHLWPKIPFYCYKKVFFEQKELLAENHSPVFTSFKELFFKK